MGDSHPCTCAPSLWDLLWWTPWDPREQLDIRKRFLPEFKRYLDNAFQNMVWILVGLMWSQKLVIIMDPFQVQIFYFMLSALVLVYCLELLEEYALISTHLGVWFLYELWVEGFRASLNTDVSKTSFGGTFYTSICLSKLFLVPEQAGYDLWHLPRINPCVFSYGMCRATGNHTQSSWLLLSPSHGFATGSTTLAEVASSPGGSTCRHLGSWKGRAETPQISYTLPTLSV